MQRAELWISLELMPRIRGRATGAKWAPAQFGCLRCQTTAPEEVQTFARSRGAAGRAIASHFLLYSSTADARAFMARSNPEISRRRAIASAE
jgi:hypothetical protein